MPPTRPPRQDPDSRLAGLALTLLFHAALVAGWQQARKLGLPQQGEADFVQWVRVEPRLPEGGWPKSSLTGRARMPRHDPWQLPRRSRRHEKPLRPSFRPRPWLRRRRLPSRLPALRAR